MAISWPFNDYHAREILFVLEPDSTFFAALERDKHAELSFSLKLFSDCIYRRRTPQMPSIYLLFTSHDDVYIMLYRISDGFISIYLISIDAVIIFNYCFDAMVGGNRSTFNYVMPLLFIDFILSLIDRSLPPTTPAPRHCFPPR